MNAEKRPVSEFFLSVNTFLRSIRDIHHDDKLLGECFVNVWAREFDANAVASYAFNLPALSFKKQNELFREKVIEKSEIFSEHLCLDPIFVYGHVGHGKTTYLRHLMKVRRLQDPVLAPLAKQVYFMYLEYTLSDPKGRMIESDLRENFQKCVDEIFEEHGFEYDYKTLGEIFPVQRRMYARLNSTKAPSADRLHQFILRDLSEDRLLYLRHISRWLLSGHRIKICCIVDNVDRHLSQFGGENIVVEFIQVIIACFVQVIRVGLLRNDALSCDFDSIGRFFR